MKSQSWHLTFLRQFEAWSDWHQAQRMRSIEKCARTCQSFFSLAGYSAKTGEELSRNPAVQVRHRWTWTPLAEAREKDASCVDVPAMQRKTASSIKAKARAKPGEEQRARLTRTAAPSLRVSAATVARKATPLMEPIDSDVAAVEDTREIDEECACWPDDDDSGTDTS